MEAATRVPQTALLSGAAPDERVVDEALTLAARRVAGEPLQYLTGIAGFRRLELAVGPGALVPRPETELVAGRAMERLISGGVLVDVGTGSGAIALSVADERPDARVLATDVSNAALAWARKNAAALGADIELIECDLLTGLPAELRGHVDVVVSNPPYVSPSERDRLPEDVVRHEPHEALFSEEDGLVTLRRLTSAAFTWLRKDGWLVSEIGERQAPRAREAFENAGFRDISVSPDLAGRDRIVEGKKP